jgi:hypothetical protein
MPSEVAWRNRVQRRQAAANIVIARISRRFLEKPNALAAKAFSSEVGTGSREENASKQKTKAPFRFHRNKA